MARQKAKCEFCLNNHHAFKMRDGYKVCEQCKPVLEKYYTCRYCNKPLPLALAIHCRKSFSLNHCDNIVCKTKDDIAFGRICCEKAVKISCVCAHAYECEEHAPNGMHVGTHD